MNDATRRFWEEMGGPTRDAVSIRGTELRRGSRVLVRPRSRGDVLDKMLEGKIGIVEGIDEDIDGNVLIVLTLEEDPGRDLGDSHFPGHRFYFATDEIEPILESNPPTSGRVLVAGIGNIFLGDDAFGCEVVRRLVREPLPSEVDVVDFGIRSLDLAYRLQDGYRLVVFVDAMPRGDIPGTLYVLEPEIVDDDEEAALETHNMDPVRVLRFARKMGRIPPRTLVVGCEPERLGGPQEEVLVELSEPVRAAVEEAAKLVVTLIREATGSESSREVT